MRKKSCFPIRISSLVLFVMNIVLLGLKYTTIFLKNQYILLVSLFMRETVEGFTSCENLHPFTDIAR